MFNTFPSRFLQNGCFLHPKARMTGFAPTKWQWEKGSFGSLAGGEGALGFQIFCKTMKAHFWMSILLWI
jgi:hypothetical protein